jgi:hypothetical protein
MKLPADCPYATKPPPRDADETIACCRVQGRYPLLREGDEPLCRTMRIEAEVYRFTWRGRLDGDAVVRIGHEITIRCVYRSSLFGDAVGVAAELARLPTRQDLARSELLISAIQLQRLV